MLVDILALSVTSTILFYLGYSFGENYKQIFPYLDKYKFVIFGIFILVIAIILIRKKIISKQQTGTLEE